MVHTLFLEAFLGLVDSTVSVHMVHQENVLYPRMICPSLGPCHTQHHSVVGADQGAVSRSDL